MQSRSRIGSEDLRRSLRHIIVISLDACAASHLSCYGYARPTTPFLDRIAADGILFRQFFCEYPNTGVNFRSIMLSEYPEMNEHWPTFPQLRKGNSRSLAEHFQSAGFATACFSGNSFFGPNHGHGDGWDVFQTAKEFAGHLRANMITDMAINWLDGRDPGKERILLWAHYLEPHNPYHASPPWDHMFAQGYPKCPGSDEQAEFAPVAAAEASRQPPDEAVRHVEAAYDGSLAFADREIARLLTKIQEMGVIEQCLVMVTADHGEGWGEHNRYCHNNCVYDEEMRVPMIVRLPQAFDRKHISTDAIAESVDILPTLLDCAGIGPGDLEADGVSMLPVLTGESDSVKPYVYGRAGQEVIHTGASQQHVFSIRTRSHKLVWDTLREALEFYDIGADPLEKHNIYDAGDALCRDLEDRLKRWLEARRQADNA